MDVKSKNSAFNIGSLAINQGELWALGGAFAYALDNVFAAGAVRGSGINTILGAGVRSLPVLVFALLMSLAVNRRSPRALSPFSDWKLVGALVGNGILTFLIGNSFLFAAFHAGGVQIATPVVSTQVLWSALLAALFLREPVNRKMFLGIGISILGIFTLTIGKGLGSNLQPGWWLSVPYALTAAVSWSVSSVLITYVMRRGVDRFQALAVALVVGLVCLNGYLLFAGLINLYTVTPLPLIGKVILAGMFNMVALVCATTALSLTTVASAGVLNSLQVGIAPLIAWAVLGEQMNLEIAAGIVLIILGVIVVQRFRYRAQP